MVRDRSYRTRSKLLGLLLILWTNVRLSICQNETDIEPISQNETDIEPIIDWDYENVVALRWSILNPPTVEYDKLRFDTHFTVSDYIEADKHVRYDIYSSADCSNEDDLLTNNDLMKTWVSEDDTPVGLGIDTNIKRIVTVSNSLVAQNITKSNSYIEDDESIVYCVRFSLWNDDGTGQNSTEINHLAVTITLSLDFTDEDFSINGKSVEAKDVGVKTTDDEFFVQAFLCNENGKRPSDVVPLRQGDSVRICVSPTEQAREVGFRMRHIDKFTFVQNLTSQEAVLNEVAAPNLLTELTCNPGSEQCVFETLLFSYFYSNPQANVAGNGVATLQWGNVDNTDRYLEQQQPYSHDGNDDDDNINRIYEDDEIRWLQERSSSKVIQVPIFAILAEDESDYKERYDSMIYGSISNSKSSARVGSIRVIIVSLLAITGLCFILFGLLRYSRRHGLRSLCRKRCITIENSKETILSEGL